MPNITVDKNTYKVDPLYQWDKNQVLYIYGLSILDPEIHFANEAMSRALVVQPTVDEKGVISVEVPNSLLQKPYSITVYVCGYEDSTFKTYYKIGVPVKPRSKPGDYTLENDDEVYSFNEVEKRLHDLETTDGIGNTIDINSYIYDDNSTTLSGQSKKVYLGEGLSLVSASLNAIKKITDKFKTLIDSVTNTANKALSIAKGKNQARVFATTEVMEEWLSDDGNVGLCNVGDNLYIVDTGVPDWWISEVLTKVDADTGFYYKIAQLETQKVDLDEIETLKTDVSELQASALLVVSFDPDTGTLITKTSDYEEG